MSTAYEEIGPYASILGTFFYSDPVSDKAAAAFAWLEDEASSQEWLYGRPDAAGELDCMRAAFRSRGADGLHKAYNRLFVGPHRLPAPPWGSVYTDPEGVIFGNKTLAVREWLRRNHVTLHLEEYEPEDHFGIMLMMVAWAAVNDVPENEIDELLEDHLLTWSRRFLDRFIEGADDDFYSSLGRLARLTLDDWTMRFDLHPEPVRLKR